MAYEATFVSGYPVMADYTPSGAAVAAGAVVVVSNQPRVAHIAIADGEKAALAVGGGIYEMTGDAAISSGKKVYWDDTNNKVTETSTSNKLFGWTVSACSADAAKCQVYHQPL